MLSNDLNYSPVICNVLSRKIEEAREGSLISVYIY